MKYKALMTRNSEECEHTQLTCLGCSAVAFYDNEKPFDSEAFIKAAEAVRESMELSKEKEG